MEDAEIQQTEPSSAKPKIKKIKRYYKLIYTHGALEGEMSKEKNVVV